MQQDDLLSLGAMNMQTFRIFDCTTISEQESDILIFCPRWLAALITKLKGRHWDFQAEWAYQRYYERAQGWEPDDGPEWRI